MSNLFVLNVVLTVIFLLAFIVFAILNKRKETTAKTTIAIILFSLSLTSAFLIGAQIGEKNQANKIVNNLYDMEQEVGIINGKECKMVISQSINTTGELSGAMFLFAGSINGKLQDNLRMGYIAPDGASYIYSLPISKVVFYQKENVQSSGSFYLIDWDNSLTFQENINQHLDKISINLTPDAFQRLIQ